MYAQSVNPRMIAILALGLPVGLFAAYIAYLVVPEIVRVVVPVVVENVVGS
jgi:hypothetical protein